MNLHGQEDNYGSMCECGYRRKKNVGPCPCGDNNCSKTGPDGAVCTNPYHSQDI